MGNPDASQLLFSILASSGDEALRSNIVIALGDVAFRFPNLMEPWTGHFYAKLRDPSARVRKNTLMVRLAPVALPDAIRYDAMRGGGDRGRGRGGTRRC
jgi:condensin complex subunit 1